MHPLPSVRLSLQPEVGITLNSSWVYARGWSGREKKKRQMHEVMMDFKGQGINVCIVCAVKSVSMARICNSPGTVGREGTITYIFQNRA